MADFEGQFVHAMESVYRIIDNAYSSTDAVEGADIDDLIDLRGDLEIAADSIQDILNAIDEEDRG